MFGVPEILIIAVIALIILFGGKKIVDLARSMGRFTGEFKKGKQEVERELQNTKNEFDESSKKEDESKKGNL